VGSFPNWDRWGEWNGMYRDTIRRWVKGDGGLKKELAQRLSGSSDLYHINNRKPYHSLNFITAHDGFSLRDLVTYNMKHNEANGYGRTRFHPPCNFVIDGIECDQITTELRWIPPGLASGRYLNVCSWCTCTHPPRPPHQVSDCLLTVDLDTFTLRPCPRGER